MGYKRELFRIAVERTGTVRRGDETAACEVLDLTEKGVQLKTDLPLKNGELLQLDFSLTDAIAIHCGLHVTHVSGTSVGTSITDIAPADQEHLSRFIDALIAMNLGGF